MLSLTSCPVAREERDLTRIFSGARFWDAGGGISTIDLNGHNCQHRFRNAAQVRPVENRGYVVYPICLGLLLWSNNGKSVSAVTGLLVLLVSSLNKSLTEQWLSLTRLHLFFACRIGQLHEAFTYPNTEFTCPGQVLSSPAYYMMKFSLSCLPSIWG